MRKIALALALSLAGSLSLGGVARAAGPTVVFPTGVASVDVPAVQLALDGGGTVLLKATSASGAPTSFDFGPSSFAGSSVTVLVDVDVEGETTPAGAMTTIHGGWGPMAVVNGANATVAGLRFDHPFEEAIFAFRPGSLRITGNRIEHVVGLPLPPGFTEGGGIIAGGGSDVVITDNVVDDVDAALGEGIEQFGALGHVEIARNRVTGVNEAGIEATQYVTIPGLGTSIHDNYVRPGLARYAVGSAGTGIEINGHGTFAVTRNEVICENPNAACIFVFGFSQFRFGPNEGATITHNTIRSDTGPFGIAGIGFIGQVSHALVAQNAMYGSGFAAVALFGCGCEPASLLDSDMFLGNQIATMRSGVADFFFDTPTHAATIVGLAGTVIDLGTDDVFTGHRATSGASIGSRLSAAMTAHVAVLNDLETEGSRHR